MLIISTKLLLPLLITICSASLFFTFDSLEDGKNIELKKLTKTMLNPIGEDAFMTSPISITVADGVSGSPFCSGFLARALVSRMTYTLIENFLKRFGNNAKDPTQIKPAFGQIIKDLETLLLIMREKIDKVYFTMDQQLATKGLKEVTKNQDVHSASTLVSAFLDWDEVSKLQTINFYQKGDSLVAIFEPTEIPTQDHKKKAFIFAPSFSTEIQQRKFNSPDQFNSQLPNFSPSKNDRVSLPAKAGMLVIAGSDSLWDNISLPFLAFCLNLIVAVQMGSPGFEGNPELWIKAALVIYLEIIGNDPILIEEVKTRADEVYTSQVAKQLDEIWPQLQQLKIIELRMKKDGSQNLFEGPKLAKKIDESDIFTGEQLLNNPESRIKVSRANDSEEFKPESKFNLNQKESEGSPYSEVQQTKWMESPSFKIVGLEETDFTEKLAKEITNEKDTPTISSQETLINPNDLQMKKQANFKIKKNAVSSARISKMTTESDFPGIIGKAIFPSKNEQNQSPNVIQARNKLGSKNISDKQQFESKALDNQLLNKNSPAKTFFLTKNSDSSLKLKPIISKPSDKHEKQEAHGLNLNINSDSHLKKIPSAKKFGLPEPMPEQTTKAAARKESFAKLPPLPKPVSAHNFKRPNGRILANGNEKDDSQNKNTPASEDKGAKKEDFSDERPSASRQNSSQRQFRRPQTVNPFPEDFARINSSSKKKTTETKAELPNPTLQKNVQLDEKQFEELQKLKIYRKKLKSLNFFRLAKFDLVWGTVEKSTANLLSAPVLEALYADFQFSSEQMAEFANIFSPRVFSELIAESVRRFSYSPVVFPSPFFIQSVQMIGRDSIYQPRGKPDDITVVVGLLAEKNVDKKQMQALIEQTVLVNNQNTQTMLNELQYFIYKRAKDAFEKKHNTKEMI